MKFKIGTKEYEIEDSKITEAITAGTSVLELATDAIVRTATEDAAFVENMKKEARNEGLEIAIKTYRQDNNLDFQGKNIKALVEAVSKKALADAGVEEPEQVKKLTQDLKEKSEALKNALTKAEQAENGLVSFKSQLKLDKVLDSFIPENTLIPIEDMRTLLKTKINLKEEADGSIVVTDAITGLVIKNATTADPEAPKAVIENFFRDNAHYVKSVEGGRGGKDSSSANGKITIEQFMEEAKSEGLTMNSPEYNQKLESLTKAGKIELE